MSMLRMGPHLLLRPLALSYNGAAMIASLPTATVHTIGCRLNQAESAILADRLQAKGYRLVDYGQPTDLLVLNTCSVTEEAERDCRYAIRRTLRRSPGAFVAVTGCYAQTGVESLRRLAGIDLILGSQFKMALPDYLPDPAALHKQPAPHVLHTRRIEHAEFMMAGAGDYETTRAYLKIQDGCGFMCSFCIIPFARGQERSRNSGDVLREAAELAARGHRELVLTGVNIGRYAADGCTLLGLIRRLEAIEGIERIRISSIEPSTISEELLAHMAASSKLCRHLHIPLQSGDDGLLRAMHRRYTLREYAALVEKAAAMIPDLALGTDLMVGFPGEGEQAFSTTCSAVADLPFAYLHVFSFSRRPGTAAARLRDAVAPAVVSRRSRVLAGISRAKRLAFYQRFTGRTLPVLFEDQAQGRWTGLTDNYIRVGVASPRHLANRLEPVTIAGAMDGLAVGSLAPAPCGILQEADCP